MSGDREQWHLDKRVPIALVLAIMVQTGGAIWWAASMQGRVTATEQSLSRLDARTNVTRVSQQTQAVQLGRIEEQIDGLRDDMGRVLNAVEGWRQP